MTPVSMPGWSEVIEAFSIFGLPWLSQFKQLDIHFKLADFDTKGVFNFFGSLFGLATFAYLTYFPPSDLERLPPWWLFLILAFLVVILFLGVYLNFRAQVQKNLLKWPVLVNFTAYVLLWIFLTSGFGLLRVKSLYSHLEGNVFASSPGEDVPLNEVTVAFENLDKNLIASTKTNNNGHFGFYLPNEKLNDVSRIRWIASGYKEDQQSRIDTANVSSVLEKRVLTKTEAAP